jgi:hypothetical protein
MGGTTGRMKDISPYYWDWGYVRGTFYVASHCILVMFET